MKLFTYGIVLLCTITTGISMAQESHKATLLTAISKDTVTDAYKPFDFHLQVKNMHLWRGYRVTDAPMTAADVSYTSKDSNFKAGLWGGAGFNGDYTEFDYYMTYQLGQFSFALWDINNFSNYPDAEIFNYDNDKTSHFVDLTAAYAFKNIPLSMSWSTILIGRDTYITDTGKHKNAFTNYLQLQGTVYKRKHSSLSLFVAAAFSFVSKDYHFYGDEFLNSFGVIYQKDVKVLNSFYLPVSATAMWNPDQEYGAIQLAVNLF